MRPKLITFDYGSTLCQEVYLGDREGLARLMPHVVKNPQNASVDDLLQAGKLFHATNGLYSDFETQSIQFMKFIFDYYAIELDIDEAKIEREFFAGAVTVTPMPHIDDLLTYLHKMNMKTAVISNLPLRSQTLEDRLHSTIKNTHFEFVMTSADYRFKKPAVNLFQLALHRAGVEPSDAWHCGDNYECDFIGAKNAGMTPVLFGKFVADGLSFLDWTDMLNYLKALD